MNDKFVRLYSMTPVADRSVRVDLEIAGDRFEETIFEEAVFVGDGEIPRLRDSGLLDRLQTDNLAALGTIVKSFDRVLAGESLEFPMDFLPWYVYRARGTLPREESKSDDDRLANLVRLISAGAPWPELIAVLHLLRDAGVAAKDVRRVLERLRERCGTEAEDDLILELSDIVTGFCSPRKRIWESEFEEGDAK